MSDTTEAGANPWLPSTSRPTEAPSGRKVLTCTLVLGAVGLAVGVGIQGAIDAASAPSNDQWGQLGTALVFLMIGVPAIAVATLVSFGVARVRWWPIASVVAMGLAVVAADIATPLVAARATDTPVVWPWCAALAYALTVTFFQLARWPSGVAIVAALIAILVALSAIGTHRRQEQWRVRTVESITATGLPILTTEVEGYAPRSASGDPILPSASAGPEIAITFRPDPPGGRPHLGPSVRMHTFRRPALFRPPADCPSYNLVSSSARTALACTPAGPGIWWSESDHAAIREEGEVIVVIRGDTLEPQPRALLVEAAERVHATDVETLAGYRW